MGFPLSHDFLNGRVRFYQGTLADADNYAMPTALPAIGFVIVSDTAGANMEYGIWTNDNAAAVTLLHNSANCVNSDSANKLCIFDNGTSVSVRNRLGGNRVVTILLLTAANARVAT